jgi:hypothetical protein
MADGKRRVLENTGIAGGVSDVMDTTGLDQVFITNTSKIVVVYFVDFLILD